MTHYVLIHGAWHGGWCWKKVKKGLESRGHHVETPDLPSHGGVKGGFRWLFPWKTDLSDYIDSVTRLVEGSAEPVVLVGHSMAGMVITGVGDRLPEKIKKLVYLCAFVPPAAAAAGAATAAATAAAAAGEKGVALGELAPAVSPILPADQRVNLLRGGVAMKKDRVAKIFYNQCSKEDIEFAKSRLCLQPLRAFGEPLALPRAENWGRVSKMAIICEQDGAITPEGQRQMADKAGITEQVALESDHSPFFSHTEELVKLLAAQ